MFINSTKNTGHLQLCVRMWPNSKFDQPSSNLIGYFDLIVFISYCPQEDIVPPFAPAPAPPRILPLPFPVFLEIVFAAPLTREEYRAPALPQEEYGPPATTTLPPPPPPTIFEGPYPAPTTEAPLPPTISEGPYPPATTSAPPPPPPPLVEGPYPASTASKYDTDSDLTKIVPGIRSPSFAKEVAYNNPRIEFSKKVTGFPKLTSLKKKLFRRVIHWWHRPQEETILKSWKKYLLRSANI